MNYNIKGTNLAISPEIREYVEKRLGRLELLLRDQGAARFDIELEYRPAEEKMYRAECMLHDPKLPKELRAEVRAGTLHEAIDRLQDELFTEITRTKKRHLARLRQGAQHAKDFLRGWRRNA